MDVPKLCKNMKIVSQTVSKPTVSQKKNQGQYEFVHVKSGHQLYNWPFTSTDYLYFIISILFSQCNTQIKITNFVNNI